jgi:nucleoside-diphosphate-sugar epimerase
MNNWTTTLTRTRQVAFEQNADLPKDYQEQIYAEELRSLEAPCIKENCGNRRILLVGGAGYIGTVVADHLLRHGYSVRCLDLLLYENHCCVLPYLLNPNYDFVHGDLTDLETINAVLGGCTDVVILGGLVGDPITKKYPTASKKINLDGMRNFIRRLRSRGLNKVIFVSTCSNYGRLKEDEKADEKFPLTPLSLYAEAKVEMEKELLAGSHSVDYHGTVLRFATAFGLSPRMRFDLTVNEFTRELYLQNDLVVFDADTWRPYCHVQDFALLIRRVLEAPVSGIDFEVFNAGGDMNNCTKQMIVNKILVRLPDAHVWYQEKGPDPRNYRVNFEKARSILYFEPKYTIDEGISEIIAALRQGVFDRVDLNANFYGNYKISYDA